MPSKTAGFYNGQPVEVVRDPRAPSWEPAIYVGQSWHRDGRIYKGWHVVIVPVGEYGTNEITVHITRLRGMVRQ